MCTGTGIILGMFRKINQAVQFWIRCNRCICLCGKPSRGLLLKSILEHTSAWTIAFVMAKGIALLTFTCLLDLGDKWFSTGHIVPTFVEPSAYFQVFVCFCFDSTSSRFHIMYLCQFSSTVYLKPCWM